jgi:hypothetical protein
MWNMYYWLGNYKLLGRWGDDIGLTMDVDEESWKHVVLNFWTKNYQVNNALLSELESW